MLLKILWLNNDGKKIEKMSENHKLPLTPFRDCYSPSSVAYIQGGKMCTVKGIQGFYDTISGVKLEL